MFDVNDIRYEIPDGISDILIEAGIKNINQDKLNMLKRK